MLYYSSQPVPIEGLDILSIDIGEGHHEDEHNDDEVKLVNDCEDLHAFEDLRAFDDLRAYEAHADDEGAFYV